MQKLRHHLVTLFSDWSGQSGDGAAELAQIIHHLNETVVERPITPNVLPVVEEWLDRCEQAAAPALQSCLQALRQAKLHWMEPSYSYGADALAGKYAVVRLVGYGEMCNFHSDTILAGFTIQAPHTFYASHWHPAVEFYGVLSGTGGWQVNNEPFVQKRPGTLLYHPSNIPHAMKTADEPMLTMYGWIGDIKTWPVMKDGDELG